MVKISQEEFTVHSLIYSFIQQMIIESTNKTDKNPCLHGASMLLGVCGRKIEINKQTLVNYIVHEKVFLQ